MSVLHDNLTELPYKEVKKERGGEISDKPLTITANDKP